MVRIFATPSKGYLWTTGVVVQLVRIHACHAWGRGFESRPFRQVHFQNCKNPLIFKIKGFLAFQGYPKIAKNLKFTCVIRASLLLVQKDARI